jgi:hypothetical protein
LVSPISMNISRIANHQRRQSPWHEFFLLPRAWIK